MSTETGHAEAMKLLVEIQDLHTRIVSVFERADAMLREQQTPEAAAALHSIKRYQRVCPVLGQRIRVPK